MTSMKSLVYALTCLFFSIIIGAGVYEHLAVWPLAYSAPPSSLSMFQGDYGLNAEAFWTKIHPITMIFMIISLILFWKTERRKNILIVFGGYIIVMVVTMIYFVPELISITSTEFSDTTDDSLVSRGSTWEVLSLIRLGIIAVLALVLYSGLSKTDQKLDLE